MRRVTVFQDYVDGTGEYFISLAFIGLVLCTVVFLLMASRCRSKNRHLRVGQLRVYLSIRAQLDYSHSLARRLSALLPTAALLVFLIWIVFLT